MAKHWNKLSREALQAPAMKVLGPAGLAVFLAAAVADPACAGDLTRGSSELEGISQPQCFPGS